MHHKKKKMLNYDKNTNVILNYLPCKKKNKTKKKNSQRNLMDIKMQNCRPIFNFLATTLFSSPAVAECVKLATLAEYI